jgi:XTP/dITP diphosphohydrolase
MGNKKVLKLMEDEEDRTAVFKSVIGYCEPGKEAIVFTGTVEGTISFEERGTGGFGYDPIFEYNGRTFAEMVMKKRTSFLTGVGHWISFLSGCLSEGDIFWCEASSQIPKV